MSETTNQPSQQEVQPSSARKSVEQSAELLTKVDKLLEGAFLVGLDDEMVDAYTEDATRLRQSIDDALADEEITDEAAEEIGDELQDIFHSLATEIEDGYEQTTAWELLTDTTDLFEDCIQNINDSQLEEHQKKAFQKQLEEFEEELQNLSDTDDDADLEKSICIIINRKINDQNDLINDAVIKRGLSDLSKHKANVEATLTELDAMPLHRSSTVSKLKAVLNDDLTLLNRFPADQVQPVDFLHEDGVYAFLKFREHIETPWINKQMQTLSERAQEQAPSDISFAQEEPFEILSLAYLSSQLDQLLLTKNFATQDKAVGQLYSTVTSLTGQIKMALNEEQKASWIKGRRECQVAFQALAKNLDKAPLADAANQTHPAVLKNEESLIDLQLTLVASNFQLTFSDEKAYMSILEEQKRFESFVTSSRGGTDDQIKALPKIREIEKKEQLFNRLNEQYLKLEAISPEKPVTRQIAYLLAQTTRHPELAKVRDAVLMESTRLGIKVDDQKINLTLQQLTNFAEFHASSNPQRKIELDDSERYLFTRLQTEAAAAGIAIDNKIMTDLQKTHLQHKYIIDTVGVPGTHISMMPVDSNELKMRVDERKKIHSTRTPNFSDAVAFVETFEGGGVSETIQQDALAKDDRSKNHLEHASLNLGLDTTKRAERRWNLKYQPEKVIYEIEALEKKLADAKLEITALTNKATNLEQELKDEKIAHAETRTQLNANHGVPIRAFNDDVLITADELQRRIHAAADSATDPHDALKKLFNEPNLPSRTFIVPYVDRYQQNASSLPRAGLGKKLAYRAKAAVHLNHSEDVIATTPVSLSFDQLVQVSQGESISRVIGNPALNDIPQSIVDQLRNKDGSLFCRMAPDTPMRIEFDKIIDIDRSGATDALYYRMSEHLTLRVPLSRISASGHNIDQLEREINKINSDRANKKLSAKMPVFRSFNVYGVDEIERQKAKISHHSTRTK